MPSEDPKAGELDQVAAEFLDLRPRLFAIAYRMLGSSTEAEDLVQEAWVRWQATDRSAVIDPAAFLATTTTRLAINVARSARKRREAYVGPWLPEPVDTGPGADLEARAEQGEELELAVLLLLERLSPTERAAYVLRESFDYPYGQIAAILKVSEANTRQLVSRARKRIAAGRRAPVSSAAHRRLLTAFLEAARTGDLTVLEALFASDVVNYSDGGGAVRNVSRIPVIGRTRVAKFMRAFAPRFWPDKTIESIEANGQPGALIWQEDTLVAFVTIDASKEGIYQLLWVMNPAKLARISAAHAG
ncbi:RNA polymerase sigma-70 factor [Planotetraspora phitsanulokensis]|uniref:RNA polymerase sigma24 factor n=1 Tax=Planotetraspora phitsanulokensis TaxID=575192 RepID=A0A8J3XIW8_9ACTN|nr:RNA polymerase sigma-70 factor [Planotetraspora phitsanulokensis]GII41376.1 RNA polymerase sigma24 factor [Planotetraspora phitsanulokensis]